jgi:hypothetical protein
MTLARSLLFLFPDRFLLSIFKRPFQLKNSAKLNATVLFKRKNDKKVGWQIHKRHMNNNCLKKSIVEINLKKFNKTENEQMLESDLIKIRRKINHDFWFLFLS